MIAQTATMAISASVVLDMGWYFEGFDAALFALIKAVASWMKMVAMGSRISNVFIYNKYYVRRVN